MSSAATDGRQRPPSLTGGAAGWKKTPRRLWNSATKRRQAAYI